MEKIAYRRFYEQNLADEAFNICLDKLRENDWAKLNQYTGENNATPKTFFMNVYTNVLEDFARTKMGRCTAPSWVSQLGRIWNEVFKLLCCKNKEPEALVVNFVSAGGDSDDIRNMIYTIKQKIPSCGIKGRMSTQLSTDGDDDAPMEVSSAMVNESIDNDIEQDEFENVIHALSLWLDGSVTNKKNSNKLLNDLHGLALSDETVILLRCIYQQQMKLPAAAELVGIKAHTARRRVNEAQEQINQILKNNNIGPFGM